MERLVIEELWPQRRSIISFLVQSVQEKQANKQIKTKTTLHLYILNFKSLLNILGTWKA